MVPAADAVAREAPGVGVCRRGETRRLFDILPSRTIFGGLLVNMSSALLNLQNIRGKQYSNVDY